MQTNTALNTLAPSLDTGEGTSVSNIVYDVVDIEPAALNLMMQGDDVVLIDVREAGEFEQERIPGALLMPMSFFDADTFPTLAGMKIIIMCAVGKRSYAVAKQLLQAGHIEISHMKGGINAWKECGLAIET